MAYSLEDQAQDALREMEMQAAADYCDNHGWGHPTDECPDEPE